MFGTVFGELNMCVHVPNKLFKTKNIKYSKISYRNIIFNNKKKLGTGTFY